MEGYPLNRHFWVLSTASKFWINLNQDSKECHQIKEHALLVPAPKIWQFAAWVKLQPLYTHWTKQIIRIKCQLGQILIPKGFSKTNIACFQNNNWIECLQGAKKKKKKKKQQTAVFVLVCVSNLEQLSPRLLNFDCHGGKVSLQFCIGVTLSSGLINIMWISTQAWTHWTDYTPMVLARCSATTDYWWMEYKPHITIY